MQHENWSCPKCEHRSFETNQMRAEGGLLSSMFDVATNRFTALSCSRCGYTELYRTNQQGIDKVLDLMVG